jgi:nickel-dependent lactate racemase
MIEESLFFGDTSIKVSLPDRTRLVGGDGGGPRLEPVPDQEAAVRAALAEPLGLPRVGRLVRPGARVLIAFDDPSAPSYGPIRRLAIEAILEELAEAGVSEENVSLVCANGLHRRWTHQEIASILGQELVQRFGSRLTCQDAEDPDNLVYMAW